MNETEQPTAWDTAISQLAREFAYPPTPDLTAVSARPPRSAAVKAQGSRRLSWAVSLAVVLAVLLLGALAVPQTRAAVLTFFGRIGAIRLFVDESLPPVPTEAPAPATAVPSEALQPTQRPTATPVALALLSAVPGEPVALSDLADRAGFPVWLPPSSSEWGWPDSAVAHEFGPSALVTVLWNDPNEPDRPILTLSQTNVPQLAYKMIGEDQVMNVKVNDLDGLWIAGPHRLYLPIDGLSSGGLLASNVLIWSDAQMTYRIEGDIALDDALRLAESLSPDNSP